MRVFDRLTCVSCVVSAAVMSTMPDRPKTALITGSTSGVGLAIAQALAKKDVNVVITGFGDEATILNDIQTRYNVRADYVAADLSKVSDIVSLWSKVTEIYPDGIDILVNNAGVLSSGSTESIPAAEWDQTIAVMLTAPFHLIRLCLPSMKKKGYGRIVNTSSALGIVGCQNMTAYVAAKHGIIGLTKAVALETAAHGITCNAVCPGSIDTPMLTDYIRILAQSDAVSFEDAHQKLLSSIPTGKLITPAQVAEVVEFLCLSNASSQMTGAAYLIDYGYTAQ